MRILVVDDDPGLRKSVTLILEDADYDVILAENGEEGIRRADEAQPDIILCDVRMPEMTGMEFLEAYQEGGGEALVLIMTAYGSMDLAMEAMKKGAYDYLAKPFGSDELLLTLRKAEERESLRREVGRLRTEVRSEERYGEIVARAPAMVQALEVAEKVAAHGSPVLLTGASGTGKELMARFIHRTSARSEAAFVPVNCGAIPENLLESEFFGYVQGAFSGADRDKAGLFEAAHGGTLFLDEVAELSFPLQVKLLRVLQEGEVRRVGDTETRRFDVRVISATNKDLEGAVSDGEFREDLYYRLAVLPIHLPALRRRQEEIPELVRHLLDRNGRKLGVKIDDVTPEAMEILLEYPWPGNIRELENVLERAMVLTEDGRIDLEDLPRSVREPSFDEQDLDIQEGDLSVKRRSAELERRLIRAALERTGGNRTEAAELLELSPRALRYKIKDYDVDL